METVPWRRWYGNFVNQGVSWFLISVVVIVMLMFVFFVRAVFLAPVTIENKQGLDQMNQEPSREYEKYLRDK